jgi:hypothetical protein
MTLKILHGANCTQFFTKYLLCATTDAMRCGWLADHHASWSCEANKQKMHMHETSSTTVCSTHVASVSDFSHANFLGFRILTRHLYNTYTIECVDTFLFWRSDL